MAPAKQQKQSEETVADPAEAAEAEAAEIEEQQEQAADAAEKREAAAQKRADSRSTYPDDAEPPSQVTKSGEQAYSHTRLITDADAFLGEPPHVVAGALHLNSEAYLTIEEARSAIDEFKAREV